MKPTSRAVKALAVLKAGGRIHCRPNSTRDTRLRDHEGTCVLSFGPSTLQELLALGVLAEDPSNCVPGQLVTYRVKPQLVVE